MKDNEKKQEESEKKQPELTSKQKQYLKGLAHPLNPLVHIGRDGMSEGLIEMTRKELETRELLKIKIGNNSGLEKHETAALLAQKTNSSMVQLIGKTIVLYKENPKRPKEKRIKLPSK